MNQILDPVLRKDKFEIWRKKTNDIISLVNSISSNVKTTISDTPPTAAYNGDLWWDSSTGKLKIYYDDGDSKQWLDAFTGSSSNGTPASISENPPLNPFFGDLWWDSTSGKLKIYYFDGDSCQWIDAFTSAQNYAKSEVTISEDPPVNPIIGELWWDEKSGKLKIYYKDIDSVQWVDAFVYHNNSIVNISENVPANASPGELWWNSSTGKLKIYYQDIDSVQWIDAFVYHNNSIVNTSETFPASPVDGELFYDSNSGKLKIYLDDGNSSQWIDALTIVDDDELVLDYKTILDSSRDGINVVEYDTTGTHSFLHSSPTDNWEINFTNLSMLTGTKTELTVIIQQGQQGYFPEKLNINGNFIQVHWENNLSLDSEGIPLASSESIDRIVYEIYCIDPVINNYLVLGSVNSF